MLLEALVTVVIARVTEAILLVKPHNISAVLGTPVTLQCQTNITSRPVNWYCSGNCSANTTDAAVYQFMGNQTTEKYKGRMDIIRNPPQYVFCSTTVVMLRATTADSDENIFFAFSNSTYKVNLIPHFPVLHFQWTQRHE